MYQSIIIITLLTVVYPRTCPTYTISDLHMVTLEPDHDEGKCHETHQQYASTDALIETIRNHQPVNAYIPIHTKKVFIHSGIPRKDEKQNAIILYCPGYSGPFGNARYKYNGGGVYSVSKAIASGIINTTTLTFDFPTDNLKNFNFGQTDDQYCLQLVYDYVVKKHPNRPIILFGDCRGATTILNFIASCKDWKHITAVEAVILFYPSVSLRHLSKQIAKNYLPWIPHADRLLHAFFVSIFPCYKENFTTIFDIKRCVPPQLPILICCLEDDSVVSHEEVEAIAQHLRQSDNPNIHLFTIRNPLLKHGKLTESYESAQIVNLFLKEYGFPYNSSLTH